MRGVLASTIFVVVQKIKIDWDQYKNDVEPETLQLFKSALAGLSPRLCML